MKNDAKSQLEDILKPDSLANKLLQIRLFQVNGNSMLFSGGVIWHLHIDAQDKTLKGISDSVDEAMSEITTILEDNQDAQGNVSLSLEVRGEDHVAAVR
jgi:hypothetical protein